MAIVPQSIRWPGKRAVLFVHGIGDASAAGDQAFPVEAFKKTMGADAADFAIYSLNFDFINDWAASKVGAAAHIDQWKRALGIKWGGDALATTVAEFAGDVLWPVLIPDIRLAVRDAVISQLLQISNDRSDAADGRGEDPLDYGMSVIAHSLGCFHTYEVLWAIAHDPQYALRPASDNFCLSAAVLMASPVQLIRSVGDAIISLVPDVATLATLDGPLGLPAESRDGQLTSVAKRFLSMTGSQDPVGGYLFGARQDWAYMNLPGQENHIDSQKLIEGDPKAVLTAALTGRAYTSANGSAVHVENPHSWEGYVSRNGAVLHQVLG